jgi:lipid-A-disaccharide synthase
MHDLDIIIITNSPGELYSWVKVTVSRLKEKNPSARVIVMLVPCPYASGKEEMIARSLPGVDLVFSPGDFLLFLAGNTVREYFPAPRGIVVFLGGDFWHALWVAWKTRFPSLAYAARFSTWLKRFDAVCVADGKTGEEFARRGVVRDRIQVVGNLMLDGVQPVLGRDEAFEKWFLSKDKLTVGILPGSRTCHVMDSLPVFLRAAEEIEEALGGVQFILGLSPFVSTDDLRECLREHAIPIQGSWGTLEPGEAGELIVTGRGTRVLLVKERQYDVMNVSDLLITIPGTNTAEIAALTRPMIVASSWKARIPRGGFGWLLNLLPPRSPMRKAILQGIARRLKFTSLPNQAALRNVVPEVMVEKNASEISEAAIELLRDGEKRESISRELKGIMGQPGAADKVGDLILSKADAHRSRLRAWVFKWRGYILLPLALLALYLGKPTVFSFILGLAVALAGEAVRIWGVGYAGATTRDSKVVAPRLVTAGPYAHVKNPLYLGNFITALGFCVVATGGMPFHTSLMLYCLFLVSYLGVYGLIIPQEEDYLLRTFGDEYYRYSLSVPRVIPRMKPYASRYGVFSWKTIFKAEIHTVFMVAAMAVLFYLKMTGFIPGGG